MMTVNTDTKETLTEDEVNEINETIIQLQKDITIIEDNVKAKEFNNALKNIVKGMKHTECPVCKEKLLKLSAEIIKTRASCNEGKGNCELLIKETIEKSNDIKNEFIPIATEKNFVNRKQSADTSKLPEIPLPKDILESILNE